MLTNEELMQINGGAFTATLLNALSRAVETLYNLGRSIGSSIRRASSNLICR